MWKASLLPGTNWLKHPQPHMRVSGLKSSLSPRCYRHYASACCESPDNMNHNNSNATGHGLFDCVRMCVWKRSHDLARVVTGWEVSMCRVTVRWKHCIYFFGGFSDKTLRWGHCDAATSKKNVAVMWGGWETDRTQFLFDSLLKTLHAANAKY